MTATASRPLPRDYARRIKQARSLHGLTQAKFAERVGVTYVTVNRWENEQTRPSPLAWQHVLEIEAAARLADTEPAAFAAAPEAAPPQSLDFAADPRATVAVAEAHRLALGHLFNPAFATETALIDPLPHQRVAVYERMLQQAPLRFLLADDAGAGKTIMTGLYAREMLYRRLIRRVLIVPPAGLVGNWEQELRRLFRLRFRIVSGADARTDNPFLGPDGDRVIVSVDTLAGDRAFNRLQEAAAAYDLVVFDEAHKLAAHQRPDYRIRKTARYKLAEAVAGGETDDDRRRLPWSAQHLLLLTATPHMGKDYPYYALWRLLLPEGLSTPAAFAEMPRATQSRHFLRRTKEEMVSREGAPLFPQRLCRTLSYDLAQGAESEQALYDDTTDYIRDHYNQARILNDSAARLAMSVFQRRLASSSYALLRSFERRLARLESLSADLQQGLITEAQLERMQLEYRSPDDPLDVQTADEEAASADAGEGHESVETQAVTDVVPVTLAEIREEQRRVDALLRRARRLFETEEDSKFETLREALTDPEYAGQKFLIFTEHRDTAHFLVRRLEGLGFTGLVAQIHGGMPYQEREAEVAFFRRAAEDGGAQYLVATDAAGEGINLQFCWLMVNYDIPWNPARLEQRMGRIHRYGQKHDPVVILNLVAGNTREGRVLKALLDKLETIRGQLRSDKVFDVIGRLFENLSIRDCLAQALTDGQAEAVATRLTDSLTADRVEAFRQEEAARFGNDSAGRQPLTSSRDPEDKASFRRLLPGHVRRFVAHAAPLLDLRIEGDLDAAFALSPTQPGARDLLLPLLETYPESMRGRLTVGKGIDDAIWMHPGEPVFDALSDALLERYGTDALRGAIFIDPKADAPYLLHMALISVSQSNPTVASDAEQTLPAASHPEERQLRDIRLVAFRQTAGGSLEQCPVELWLELLPADDVVPSRIPLAVHAPALTQEAEAFARDVVAGTRALAHRKALRAALPERLAFVNRGFDHQGAELAQRRTRLKQELRKGHDARAARELERVKVQQRSLDAKRARRLADLESVPDRILADPIQFLAHALAVPSPKPHAAKRSDAEVETIAFQAVRDFEARAGADVRDVSTPERAQREGLGDWPGFDLLSYRPHARPRAIEVKGRAGTGEILISGNEWASACNNGDEYWLYVVMDCATAHPRVLTIQNPFQKFTDRTLASLKVPYRAILDATQDNG